MKSLHELPLADKLLIVDDAHERTDSKVLFQFAASTRTQTKLLIVTRSYGQSLLRSQAAQFFPDDSTEKSVKLGPLSVNDSIALAEQVLSHLGADIRTAGQIAKFTQDNILATVIAAYTVAKENLRVDLISTDKNFERLVTSRFQDVLTGKLGVEGQEKNIKSILKLIALLQPLDVSREEFAHLALTNEHIQTADTVFLLKVLEISGVIYKRAGRHRLSPDMLADYIVEQVCEDVHKSSADYLDTLLEILPNHLLKNLLLNLSKCDWRQRLSDTAKIDFLSSTWRKIFADESNLSFLSELAYYQPERALKIVEEHIRAGNLLEVLTEIAKNASYNLEFTKRACSALWELGKNNKRTLNQTPSHGIRLLQEMCQCKPGTSTAAVHHAIDFALSCLENNETGCAYSPFDVLKGVMKTEGSVITPSGPGSISIGQFHVPISWVADSRQRIIEATCRWIRRQGNDSRCIMAGKFLGSSFYHPANYNESEQEEWDLQFLRELQYVKENVDFNRFYPFALVEMLRGLNFHITHGNPKIASVIYEIESAADELAFKLSRGMIDGYGDLTHEKDYEQRIRRITFG
ncbi:MAG: hypothetical protein IPJ49_14095 [Candidatus Obscuribacter sp.]|nr:hypothetical protein [Candidatus Obscuribacter sp.]